MLTILDRPSVDKDALDQLMRGDCTVIWCRSYVPPLEASAIASQILKHCAITPYRNIDPAVGRIGQSFYETVNSDGSTDAGALEIYLDRTPSKMEEIEHACAPHEVPTARLYREMDKLYGAVPASILGRDMFAGAVRIIPSGKDVVPHNDSFARDAPDFSLAAEVDAQFSANIYLSMPELGGAIEIWDLRPSDDELAQLPPSKSGYGHDREWFKPADITLKPSVGDLLFFRTDVIHAVTLAEGGVRMNINCFFARRRDSSLIYWS